VKSKYIIVTVGDNYYKIDAHGYRMYSNYPRPLSIWWDKSRNIPNLPMKLDGAYLDKNQRLFFLENGKYYYYNTQYDKIQFVGELRDIFDCPNPIRSNIVNRSNIGRLSRSIEKSRDIKKSDDNMILIDNGGLIPLETGDSSVDVELSVNTEEIGETLGAVTFVMPPEDEEEEYMIMVDNGGLTPMEDGDLPVDVDHILNAKEIGETLLDDTFVMPPEDEDDDDMIMIDNGGLTPMEYGDLPVDVAHMINTEAMEQVMFNERRLYEDGHSSSMVKTIHSFALIVSLVLCFFIESY